MVSAGLVFAITTILWVATQEVGPRAWEMDRREGFRRGDIGGAFHVYHRKNSRIMRSKGGDGPGENVLLVCTGNTCRSPMAEAILARLAGEEGLKVSVRSAGLFAMDGAEASENTSRVLG